MSSSRPPLWSEYEQQLADLGRRQPNFDLAREHEYTEKSGWRVDSYQAELPPEPPGEPLPYGSWQIAREVIENYEFPDPDLITGIYAADLPLEGRCMLLRGRFLFFTFYFGVKIGQVIDEVRKSDQGPVRVAGFSYHTLEGHFEMGKATFTVWKFLGTGRVEFRFNAYSRTGRIDNIFYRIGFALFGRGLQKRFARQILKRMQHIVTERLAAARRGMPEPQVKSTLVKPASDSPAAQEKLEAITEDSDS